MSSRVKGIISIMISAFGFALMAMCVRLCDDYGAPVSCFEKGFFRNFVAFLCALAVFRRAGVNWFGIKGKDFVILLLRSILGTIGIFANFYALSHIPIADGQTLNKTAPFFTLVCAWIFLGEKASWRQFAAVLVAFSGVALVAKPGFAGDSAFPLAMGLLGGVCAGGAYAAVRALGKRETSPSLIVLFFSAFSCMAAIPFVVVDFTPLTFAQSLILIGAGVGAAIGQYGITFAYRFAAPREIAVYDYSNIIFTALLGYIAFGQVSDTLAFIGMVVIIAAAVMLTYSRQESR